MRKPVHALIGVLFPIVTSVSAFDFSVASEAESVTKSAAAAPPPALLWQAVNSQSGVSFHHDMFLLPLTYTERFRGDESEVVFQLSMKVNIFSDFYFGYSQRSFWQAYAKDKSSPFRETNYNPALFFRFGPGNPLSDALGFDLGLEHISNGKTAPESRSVNRLYGAVFWPRAQDLWTLTSWYRLPEQAKTSAEDPTGDDNPDLNDYSGNLRLAYQRCLEPGSCDSLWGATVHGNARTGKGGLELKFTFPAGSEQLNWYVLGFSGYGESLIDYNNAENRIGIGISLRPR